MVIINQIVQAVNRVYQVFLIVYQVKLKMKMKMKMKETTCELYQDGIEGMKGLRLPDEREIKDEKSQMYLENILNKIKNNFSNIYDKYQRFFEYIAN